MKRLLTIPLLFILSLSCNGCPPDPSVPPHPTPTVQDTDKCGAAEVNLKKLKCIPVDKPYTKKGKSFTQFCEETQAAGIFLNPKCLSEITACDQMDHCTGTTS